MLGKLLINRLKVKRSEKKGRGREEKSVNIVVHSTKEEKKQCRKQLKRTGFDYRLLKWLFVVLLCKVNIRLLFFYPRATQRQNSEDVALKHSWLTLILTCKWLTWSYPNLKGKYTLLHLIIIVIFTWKSRVKPERHLHSIKTFQHFVLSKPNVFNLLDCVHLYMHVYM